ncbi:hypothetical protein NDU88_009569 [Pleurodeles waltl]|uniref:Uncharacterized protein n=1 Tax=Pleurodeles waltl TaxID=8319 RepID=A0AAV7NZK0_PLEWA|nr:hypothetical protein NDU88_009569 [Pleurodeles waltl]
MDTAVPLAAHMNWPGLSKRLYLSQRAGRLLRNSQALPDNTVFNLETVAGEQHRTSTTYVRRIVQPLGTELRSVSIEWPSRDAGAGGVS